jgi:uncharacterized protein
MKINSVSNKFAKLLYLGIGLVFLSIGIIGFLIPIFPGFIFLVPAVFFFAKSSNRLNRIIQRHSLYKKYFKPDAAD